MAKIRKLLPVILLLFVGSLEAQDTLSLSGLLELVERNHPVSVLREKSDSVSRLEVANRKTGFMPRIDFNAEATWQSDVVSLSIPVPGVSLPAPDKDHYGLTVDINQLVWDGGAVRSAVHLEQQNGLIQKTKVEAELYALKEHLLSLYFGVIALGLTNEQLEGHIEMLNRRHAELTSMVEQGVVLESALNALLAEKIKLEQVIADNRTKYRILLRNIESLAGCRISDSALFVLPEVAIMQDTACFRPDFRLLELQRNLYDAASVLVRKKRNPKLMAFARLGYGKPGLNVLSSDFSTYGIVGARLTWNIFDWSRTARELEVQRIRKSMVSGRMEAFEQLYRAKRFAYEEQIDRYRKQLEADSRVVELLEKVTASSESKLKNGSITASQYLADINNLLRARIAMQLHRVKQVEEKVKLAFWVGKFEWK